MRKILLVLALLFALSACGLNVTPMPTETPTPEPKQGVVGAAEALLLQNMNYQMTRDAANAQQEALAAKITGTAIVESKAATQTVEARDRSDNATSQARIDRATASAQQHIDAATAEYQARSDNATAQARMDNATAWAYAAVRTETSFEVTVTAAAVGTMTAFPMTMTALPMNNTAQAASLLARGTEQSGSAELVNLTVKRQTMKNSLDAFLPWLLIMSSFIVGICAIVVFSQYRQLKRDRSGMLPVEAVKHTGGTTFIRPDLLTSPALTVNKRGQITESGAQTDFQQQTTRRAQLVEASKGKTMPEFQQTVRMFGQSSGNSGQVKYIDPDKMFGRILGDAEDDLVDGEVTDV